MLSRKRIVVGLGELLWDLFPAGKQLGGAPANFAYITSLLGDQGIPASRLGQDALGADAIRRLGELGLSTEFIQQDTDHPTGTVKVEVDRTGQPRFEISESVAWDFLEWTPQWQNLANRPMPYALDRSRKDRNTAVPPSADFCRPCVKAQCGFSTST